MDRSHEISHAYGEAVGNQLFPTYDASRSDCMFPPPNVSISRNYLTKAMFATQPPQSTRKKHSFDFVLTFFDQHNDMVQVERASFFAYECEELKPGDRNGLIYLMQFKFRDGELRNEKILITLIDSESGERIDYVGTDKNINMHRVLITHIRVCTKCLSGKKCGLLKEAPSDCLILKRCYVKVFLKCNQNCMITTTFCKKVYGADHHFFGQSFDFS
jgi:hypothetical protein